MEDKVTFLECTMKNGVIERLGTAEEEINKKITVLILVLLSPIL